MKVALFFYFSFYILRIMKIALWRECVVQKYGVVDVLMVELEIFGGTKNFESYISVMGKISW